MSPRLRSAFALVTLLAAGAAAAQPLQCKLQPMGNDSVEVTAVRDARTLALKGSPDLRLAGIETPAGQQAQAAQAALEKLTPPGTMLKLIGIGREQVDRYGRRVAFAFLPGSDQSLQQTLIDQGEAWAGAQIGDAGCARLLLTTEAAARRARRGFWADPNFAPLPADHPAQLAAEQGHFVLVEGKILSVHESYGTIYLNFGRHWTEDFSVTIASHLQNLFAGSGIDPKRLEGHGVLVRGFIEFRSGPIIDARSPEQIELLY